MTSPLHGQNLLDQWRANLSRVSVERHEIANIILDSPNGKKPGPDGLPAASSLHLDVHPLIMCVCV